MPPENIVHYIGTGTIEMIEHYATQQGYDNLWFEFIGPCFKGEHKYLSVPGCQLGTKMWYVRIAMQGRFKYAFGRTFEECAWNAHRIICELLEKQSKTSST